AGIAAAAGDNIVGTAGGGTAPEEDFDRCLGNSFAAPVVAGAAALVLANTPTLTAAEVRTRILDNAEELPRLEYGVNRGRVLDVAAAVGP
ncbi:MAG: S8 family serine peptidase, partial [Deltaproteobacteria bacterium]|nr:S8 family serine peptidase [Deltaproteobacteria bacterium]